MGAKAKMTINLKLESAKLLVSMFVNSATNTTPREEIAIEEFIEEVISAAELSKEGAK
jgi:hypothetical protein